MDAALVTDDERVILEQNIDQSNHGAITSAGRGWRLPPCRGHHSL